MSSNFAVEGGYGFQLPDSSCDPTQQQCCIALVCVHVNRKVLLVVAVCVIVDVVVDYIAAGILLARFPVVACLLRHYVIFEAWVYFVSSPLGVVHDQWRRWRRKSGSQYAFMAGMLLHRRFLLSPQCSCGHHNLSRF